MAWRSRRTPTPSPAPEAASPHPINTRALQAAEQLCSPVALGRARLQPYRYRLEGRVARSSVLVSSPITRLWVPRPCVLCKGGTRCRRCDMRPSHCVNIPTPTLRESARRMGHPLHGCALRKAGPPASTEQNTCAEPFPEEPKNHPIGLGGTNFTQRTSAPHRSQAGNRWPTVMARRVICAWT
jgi:hypothetical protein